jgi:hypothetical protein
MISPIARMLNGSILTMLKSAATILIGLRIPKTPSGELVVSEARLEEKKNGATYIHTD